MALTGRELYEQGIACERAGDIPGAFEAFRRSAKADLRITAPYLGLARILARNHQRTEAIACLERAAGIEPSNAAIRILMARILHTDGQAVRAKEEFARAFALDPDAEGAVIGLASVHEDLGERQAAADLYLSLLQRRPGNADAIAGLLGVADEKTLDRAVLEAEGALQVAPDAEAPLIGYALGKALTKCGLHARAFEAWNAANQARRRVAGPFDRAAFDARIHQLIRIFSSEFVAARQGWGNPSQLPVFIVGLPRSGTTLTEQVLSGHSDVFGAGELDILTDMATGTPGRLDRTQRSWPETALDLQQKHVDAMAREHLARLTALSDGPVLRVIDKQPLNFWHLGLLALLFPNARVVHCTRDIRDNGLSIFAENFTPEQRWATDLGDIAHYWRGYRRLMDHWGQNTSLKIMENRYEDMVEDLEPAAHRLTGFLDLGWDETCLAFHKNDRAVQTPSRWQVRQPVYKSSAGRWRVHKDRIAALCDAAEGALQ